MRLSPKNDDSGFTMIELIVAATMMIVVIGAVVSLLLSSMRTQPEVTDRAHQIGEARNALEKLTADLRQGSVADYEAPSALRLATLCDSDSGAVPCEIAYSCAAEEGGTFGCTRTVNSGAAATVVTGLASPDVFCVSPSLGDPDASEPKSSDCGASNGEPPAYVGVAIEFPAGEQDGKTVLEGGAALHNLAVEDGA